MKKSKKLFTVLLCSILILTLSMPSVVFAEESPQVHIDNNYSNNTSAQNVSGLFIDDVDKPETGKALDDKATVASMEGISWDIPVLWFDDQLQLSAEAAEGRTYCPVLAFFIPSDYTIAGTETDGGFLVKLSEDLAKLFGTQEIISIYNASSGIAYILPASFRDLFAPAKEASSEDPNASDASETALLHASEGPFSVTPADPQDPETPVDPQDPETPVDPQDPETPVDPDDPLTPVIPEGPDRSLVDIYCSMNARDALPDDDLEYLIDLVINKLEPQAVNLLLEKFPAFKTASENGEIGREIGLYIYYEKGDEDGDPAHECVASDYMAYVKADSYLKDGEPHMGYMIGINADSLIRRDKNNDPVRNPNTGKMTLTRGEESLSSLFNNSVVHELFHAFMDDYNRPGMFGADSLAHSIIDENNMNEEQINMFSSLEYPIWFKEGTASTVESNFSNRQMHFENLLKDASVHDSDDPAKVISVIPGGTKQALLSNYIFRTDEDDFPVVYSIIFSGPENNAGLIDPAIPRYVSGYLAVLYLSDLAARQSVGSSMIINEEDGHVDFSSERIRYGLNIILEEMHNGSSLDDVIANIAPKKDDGSLAYSDTNDFESKFIVGENSEDAEALLPRKGDPESLEFVYQFLTYMHNLAADKERNNIPTGSILFDFDKDFASPLDESKDEPSDYYKIIESNTYVDSTVDIGKAFEGGGKSVYAPSMFGETAEAEGSEETAGAEGTEKTGADEASEAVTPEAPAVEAGDASAAEIADGDAAASEVPAAEAPAAEIPAIEYDAFNLPAEASFDAASEDDIEMPAAA